MLELEVLNLFFTFCRASHLVQLYRTYVCSEYVAVWCLVWLLPHDAMHSVVYAVVQWITTSDNSKMIHYIQYIHDLSTVATFSDLE